MMIAETIEAYHANPAISHSKLELFRRRPIMYYKRHVEKTLKRDEPSAAFRVGSAVHAAQLEPETFWQRYALKPSGIDRRTKEGKERFAAFEAEHAGKIVLDDNEHEVIKRIAQEIAAHPEASRLLNGGHAEKSWRRDGKLPLQCRTDYFHGDSSPLGDGPAVVDLKTVESLDDDAFRKFETSAFKFGYHRQAGFYCSLISGIIGKPVTNFAFVVVEKQEPFGISVFRLAPEAIELGLEETKADLARLRESLALGYWENMPTEIRTLEVPGWYRKGAQP